MKRSTAKKFAILSPEDEDLRPYLMWTGPFGHIAIRFPGSKVLIPLGIVIIQRMEIPIPEGYEVDHKNRIPMDNTRGNLRVITRFQNKANNDAFGVSFFKRDKRWRAYVNRNHKQIHLGYHKTKEDALEARRKFLDNEGLVQ